MARLLALLRAHPTFQWMLLGAATLAVAMGLGVELSYTGHHVGLFVLRSTSALIEVSDDVYPEDVRRLLLAVPLPRTARSSEPGLTFAWDADDGSGHVAIARPDGRKLRIFFSRFRDSLGQVTHGLFLGGGMPGAEQPGAGAPADQTGMTLFDGQRWLHIWCNANELLTPANPAARGAFPSQWEFRGSAVLGESPAEVALGSTHRVLLEGVPHRVDRYVLVRASETYFLLALKITNLGQRTVPYYYVYGDEPWLGDFGSSQGDIGWVDGRLVLHEERIDTAKHSYAGMFDWGNKAATEAPVYTGAANFIEWLGDRPPNLAYFANALHAPSPAGAGRVLVPLYSPNNRLLNLQWGPEVLKPGESRTYLLAIGAAGFDHRTSRPAKPPVTVPETFRQFVQEDAILHHVPTQTAGFFGQGRQQSK